VLELIFCGIIFVFSFGMREEKWKRPQWASAPESLLVGIGIVCDAQVLVSLPFYISRHGGG
jgi:hypothetical protein